MHKNTIIVLDNEKRNISKRFYVREILTHMRLMQSSEYVSQDLRTSDQFEK